MSELPPALFFIHVMKTAGGTFRLHLLERYGRDGVFPVRQSEGPMFYTLLGRLRELPAERHRRLRAYSGHWPYCATSLVDRELTTLTVLRDPVDRIVSYLRNCRRTHPEVQGKPLEEIYEHPFLNPCFIQDHQAKVFAMVDDDEPESVMDVVEIDDKRLEIAKEQLAQVDIIGTQERFDEFLSDVSRRLGWDDAAIDDTHRGSGPDASASLRRRIRDDNQADLEFYEYALDLIAERQTT